MTLTLSNEVLNRRVFNKEVYKLHSTEFMLSQTRALMDPMRNVVDVGAAVGMYSTFWASKCARLYAFEAVPAVYKQLQKLEEQFDNVKTFNKAVSNFEGESKFYVDDKRLSNSSFRDLVGGQEITVDTTLIDMEDLGDVGFMKVDVEGHELDVLHGAIETINECRPSCMVEVYPKFNNGPVDETFNFFFMQDYKCYYHNRGIQKLIEVEHTTHGVNVAHDEELIKQHDGDFLFVPREKF